MQLTLLDKLSNIKLVSQKLDLKYYSTQVSENFSSKISAATHYLHLGWMEHASPSPQFDTLYYLNSNNDVKESEINPFVHYLRFGMAEGRPGVCLENQEQPETSSFSPLNQEELAHQIATIEDHFDEEFYKNSYPNGSFKKYTPIEHYLILGWHEGRNPCDDFDGQAYLDYNGDVASAKINPFYHWIAAGKREGRVWRHPGGRKAAIFGELRQLKETVADWCNDDPIPVDRAITKQNLLKIILEKLDNKKPHILFSFSHDNRLEISGGLQLCVQREAEICGAEKILHINLYPYQPLPRLVKQSDKDKNWVYLIIDQEVVGFCEMATMVSFARTLKTSKKAANATFDLVIHSLLGHSTESIGNFCSALKIDKPYFWLHDYFTLCTSYTLQRNMITYCDAPPIASGACGICIFGEERKSQTIRLEKLFNLLEFIILSPSKVAADLWKSKTSLSYSEIKVIPHIQLSWKKDNSRIKRISSKKPSIINIAYVGAPIEQKGWSVFLGLNKTLAKDKRYKFHYFGVYFSDRLKDLPAIIENHNVHVTADNPDSMVTALAQNNVDFLLHWAVWPETFSFSAFEGMSSGATIVTNAESGNVAAAVNKYKSGYIFKSVEECTEFLKSKDILNNLKEQRLLKGNMKVSKKFTKMGIPHLKAKTK